MRTLLAAAMAAAFSGAAFAQVADTRPALQQRLIAAAASSGYGTEGSQFGLDAGVPEGKSVRYAFALKAGESYFVVGGCDDNCTSMALLMTDANSSGVSYTEDGAIVAHTAFDNIVHPSFTMTAAKTTNYSIVINVDKCHGPSNMCVAGVAVFHKTGTAAYEVVKNDKFTIDSAGTIVVTDEFTNEMFCIIDTIDEDVAKAAGAALATGAWPAEVEREFQAAREGCADDYDWLEAEGRYAVLVNTTQSLINYTLDRTEPAGINYDDIVEIQESLSDTESAKFADGSWLKDAAMVAKLQAAIRSHGLKDETLTAMAEMAIGAFANQSANVRNWVEVLKTKK
ncbi:MAG TPA: hypothetical protein VGO52_09380 [Hyphomonadaceae bacterium]|jgi:hypothetical protein|nr:hypothetical protein [Hyphomonadaceae bacterium]